MVPPCAPTPGQRNQPDGASCRIRCNAGISVAPTTNPRLHDLEVDQNSVSDEIVMWLQLKLLFSFFFTLKNLLFHKFSLR